MIKTLQNTLRQDREGGFILPRSVQDCIPVHRLYADGIFQYGSKFSKAIRFSDINYAIASREDKMSMFLGYSEIVIRNPESAMPQGVERLQVPFFLAKSAFDF